MPLICPGLPGMTTSTRAFSMSDHRSVCTSWISSPTNLLAKPGMPSAACTLSMTTFMPPPSWPTLTVLRSACWASQTCSRNAASISISPTAIIGAS